MENKEIVVLLCRLKAAREKITSKPWSDRLFKMLYNEWENLPGQLLKVVEKEEAKIKLL
jgi:hypothetical protein